MHVYRSNRPSTTFERDGAGSPNTERETVGGSSVGGASGGGAAELSEAERLRLARTGQSATSLEERQTQWAACAVREAQRVWSDAQPKGPLNFGAFRELVKASGRGASMPAKWRSVTTWRGNLNTFSEPEASFVAEVVRRCGARPERAPVDLGKALARAQATVAELDATRRRALWTNIAVGAVVVGGLGLLWWRARR